MGNFSKVGAYIMLPDFNTLQEINGGREVLYNFLSRGYQVEAKEEYLEMAGEKPLFR